MSSGRADFYSMLAEHYDGLFGCSESLASFLLTEGARPGSRVLDVACGTGACTRALVAQRVDCHGIDLSPPMIERARALAIGAGIDPGRFSVGDMLEVDRHPAAPFEALFCVGNSISHLPSRADVARFVAVASSVTGASLVLQFVEVAGLAPGESIELPDLEAGPVVMHRRYRRDDELSITFDASLEAGEGGGSASQRLLVLDSAFLLEEIERQGYSDVRVFGGFDHSRPDPDGWLRVIVAHR